MRIKRSTAVRPILIISLALFMIAPGLQDIAAKLGMATLTPTASALQTDPRATIGEWSAVLSPNQMNWPPVVAIHTHVLPNGKVLTWQRKDDVLTTKTYLWDPASPIGYTEITNNNTHLFCSGHSFMADGQLLASGGHRYVDGDGEPHTNRFDYRTNTWTRESAPTPYGDMNAGRWYPTNTTLGNGEVLTVSGQYWDGTLAPTIATVSCDNSYDLYFNGGYKGSGSDWTQAQIFTLQMQVGKNVVAIKCNDAGGVAGLLAELKIGGGFTGTNGTWKMSLTAPANWADVNFDDSSWANATEYGSYGVAPWGTFINGMPANTPAKWIWSSNNDADNTVYFRFTFDDKGSHNHKINTVPEVWKTAGGWRPLSSPAQGGMPLYPWMLLAPDGSVFNPGPQKLPRFLDTNTGTWTNASSRSLLGGTAPKDEDEVRNYGSAVMYDVGKVLIIGGGDPPTRTTEWIDLNESPPVWRDAGLMANARRQINATILPDGKVLVTGGTSGAGFNNAVGAVRSAEMWDPGSKTWSTMASMQVPRLYHSTAVLLQDGRVLSAGGGLPAGSGGDTDHPDAEIYSPPYLFKGPRPTITNAPGAVNYGETFFVQTPDAASITDINLIRLSSVTHSFNQNQRINRLAKSQVAGGWNVTVPTNRNACPPGHYMLFILNGNGVPSVAKIIKVQDVEGNLDAADCSQIRGWAWDKNLPNTPISVDIYDGNTFLARVPANLYRQDLYNAGKGNGYHGFVYNTPSFLKDGRLHSINVRYVDANSSLSSSPRQIICGVSLFPTQVPNSVAGGAGAVWEQATQFSSSMNGKITHIRFYKANGESGTHIGRIWTDTGVELARATFNASTETPTGWQVVALTTPLSITAGVKYRVTYNVNLYVAKTGGGLSSPITNGPLTAYTSFYSTPGGSFPTTGSLSNLFADILFNSPQ